jgi:hypothetical protein
VADSLGNTDDRRRVLLSISSKCRDLGRRQPFCSGGPGRRLVVFLPGRVLIDRCVFGQASGLASRCPDDPVASRVGTLLAGPRRISRPSGANPPDDPSPTRVRWSLATHLLIRPKRISLLRPRRRSAPRIEGASDLRAPPIGALEPYRPGCSGVGLRAPRSVYFSNSKSRAWSLATLGSSWIAFSVRGCGGAARSRRNRRTRMRIRRAAATPGGLGVSGSVVSSI